MNFNSLSKRQWVLLSVSVVIVGVAFWAVQAGYLPEIGKFFAAEPGYVPSCAWHGEPLSATQQCCSAFTSVPVESSPLPVSTPATVTIPPVPTTDGSIVLKLEDRGDLYCRPDGTGVNRTAWFSWSGTAIPQSDTPVEILRFNPTSGEFEVNYTISNQNYGSTSDYYSSLPRPLAYRVRLVSDPTVISNVLEIPVDCAAQPRYPNYCVAPGCKVQLGPKGCHADYCPPENVVIVCPSGVVPPPRPSYTPTPTSTSTSTPTPPLGEYRGVMLSIGNPETMPAATPVPLALNIGVGMKYPQTSNPYFVTGLKTVIRVIEGSGRIVRYGNSTPFPDVVEQAISSDGQSLELALGVGTGRTGVRMGNTPFGLLYVEAKTGSGKFCVAIDRLQTDIAAQGVNDDVFDLNYIGGWESQTCLTVSAASVPGDANGDGKVDIFDYNLVVSNFGKTGTNVPGDVNKDGKVDIFDYNLVVSNFGK